MKVLDRRTVHLLAGLAGASALLYAIYRLWKCRTPPPEEEPAKEEEEE